jgi:hypothetical protein
VKPEAEADRRCRKNTIATFNHIFPKWAPKWSWPVIEKIPKRQQKQWLGD